MKKGAFALIDCLGFKGIWRDEQDALMVKLQSLDIQAKSRAERIVFPKGVPKGLIGDVISSSLEVKLLSDTIAISYSGKQGEDPDFFELVTMALVIQGIIDLFLKDSPHLLLRGCITHGQHITKKNFLVGPAVDDAAEYMNCAQGAFVWFLPPASDIIELKIATDYSSNKLVGKVFESLFPKYPVPIKNGHFLNTYVVSPTYMKSDLETDNIVKLYKKTMNANKMDIWMKRQHTMEFLEFCKTKDIALRDSLAVG